MTDAVLSKHITQADVTINKLERSISTLDGIIEDTLTAFKSSKQNEFDQLFEDLFVPTIELDPCVKVVCSNKVNCDVTFDETVILAVGKYNVVCCKVNNTSMDRLLSNLTGIVAICDIPDGESADVESEVINPDCMSQFLSNEKPIPTLLKELKPSCSAWLTVRFARPPLENYEIRLIVSFYSRTNRKSLRIILDPSLDSLKWRTHSGMACKFSVVGEEIKVAMHLIEDKENATSEEIWCSMCSMHICQIHCKLVRENSNLNSSKHEIMSNLSKPSFQISNLDLSESSSLLHVDRGIYSGFRVLLFDEGYSTSCYLYAWEPADLQVIRDRFLDFVENTQIAQVEVSNCVINQIDDVTIHSRLESFERDIRNTHRNVKIELYRDRLVQFVTLFIAFK